MQTILNSCAILLSLLTATGVFIHEAHVDRATYASIYARKQAVKTTPNAPAVADLVGIGADPHTHPEHNNRTLKGFSYKTPTIPPRESKMKRYLQQNIEPRGRHAFDNYSLPVVA